MNGARFSRALVAPDLGGPSEMTVEQSDRWLVARFRQVHAVASWAIIGGGLQRTRIVAWHQVTDHDLRPPIDARDLFKQRLRDASLPDAVGLLTSRNLESYTDLTRSYGDVEARCVVTVGLGNALRAGDLPGPAGRIGTPVPLVGTINVLCRLSVRLSQEALLEGLALAVEARTLAVREASIPSTRSGEPASGTGTDCIVVAAPETGAPAHYAGKHTVLGHLIGVTVRDATAEGVASWKRERETAR